MSPYRSLFWLPAGRALISSMSVPGRFAYSFLRASSGFKGAEEDMIVNLKVCWLCERLYQIVVSLGTEKAGVQGGKVAGGWVDVKREDGGWGWVCCCEISRLGTSV